MIVQELSFEKLHVIPFICGPINNNTYALIDEESRDCVVIDPSFSFNKVLEKIHELGYTPREYWLTHAHYDHILGTAYPESREMNIKAHLHPKDEILYEEALRTKLGIGPRIADCPRPMMDLEDGKELSVGGYTFKTLFTPGHAPGHCCFYCEQASWLFSGDLIFYHSYGRTDLTGGDEKVLFKSIYEKVLTLPEDTLIMPGHEYYTRVRNEKVFYS